MKLIDRQAIRHSVQEKLIKACGRLYKSERAACESDMPLPWDEEPWEEFVWRYQDYQLVFEDTYDITAKDLNYDDYETN